MNILHIQVGMGASGNAAYRLSTAMRKYGFNSNVLNLCHGPVLEHVYTLRRDYLSLFYSFFNKIYFGYKLLGKKKDTYFYHVLPLIGRDISKNQLVKDADVIYIHWISGFLSSRVIKNIAKSRKPIIFFMHDMWDFTGGCHHSFDCEKYKLQCYQCPMFSHHYTTAYKEVQELKRIFAPDNIVFVSPSRWMAKCAQESYILKGKVVQHIPNLVDDSIFTSLSKEQCKKELGIPDGKVIITFGCQSGTHNSFKGWNYLVDAVNRLTRDDIQIVIYGSEKNTETEKQVKYPITFLGRIDDEYKLAQICNATDVFVSPSLAESFGLTFLENILCGTPVVGFDNTAIKEVISHRRNGYLAKNKDSVDLCNGIMEMLEKPLANIDRMSYSSKSVVDSHYKLISKLLSI